MASKFTILRGSATAAAPGSSAETLYILECEDNKWYVGKSADVAKRFKQHTGGKGSEWTREYAPIRIAETRPITSPYDETNVTKELMKKYGIDNVRGGAHASLELSEEVEDVIRHELRAANDTCYKCGRKGHFANRCSARQKEEEVVWKCDTCDREFDTKFGCTVHERSCLKRQSVSHSETSKQGTCYRCGRPGHYSPDCYARRHVKGYELDED